MPVCWVREDLTLVVRMFTIKEYTTTFKGNTMCGMLPGQLSTLMVVCIMLGWNAELFGQGAATVRPAGAKPPAAKPAAGKKDDKPKFEVVTIETKDGVRLRAAFFPSDKKKEAVPVMMVHEWRGNASPYMELAALLQAEGYAVLLPNLRGHGSSMIYLDAEMKPQEFDIEKLGPKDVKLMLAADLESCKAFLKQQNDQGRLNLNALTVLGIGEGAVLAAAWAVNDWNFPSVGRRKQGQDVKAMVLISPQQNHRGLRIETMFRDRFVPQLPILLVAGKGSPEQSNAESIHRRLEAIKRRGSRGDVSGLTLHLSSASLSGPELVRSDPSASQAIIAFMKDTFSGPKMLQHPWEQRDR